VQRHARTPSTEETPMMPPPPARCRAGRAACTLWTWPRKLTLITRSNSSSVMSSTRPPELIAALFTQVSMRPKRSSAVTASVRTAQPGLLIGPCGATTDRRAAGLPRRPPPPARTITVEDLPPIDIQN